MSAINLDACPLDKHVRLRQGGQQVHPFPVTLAPRFLYELDTSDLLQNLTVLKGKR